MGVKRPKKAHLFPALKNLVPMATERASRAGVGSGLPGSTGEGTGRAGEGGLLQGRLERALGGKMAASLLPACGSPAPGRAPLYQQFLPVQAGWPSSLLYTGGN